MPEPRPHHAALAERNRLLSQTRTITLGIAGGAAVASLGLGVAFAHAIPGHSYHSSAAQGQPAGGQAAAPPSASSSAPARSSGAAHSSGAARGSRSGHGARRHHAIAPPTHAPAPAPAPSTSAPPPVTSGGS